MAEKENELIKEAKENYNLLTEDEEGLEQGKKDGIKQIVKK